MNYIDLFSGIGGFALGAYWAGMKFENHYFSEVEPYAVELYQKRFPSAIPLGDITKIDTGDLKESVGNCIITGGFPCQDISIAGKGEGLHGERSGLWFEYWRLIRDLLPRYAIIENVGALAGWFDCERRPSPPENPNDGDRWEVESEQYQGSAAVISSLAEIGYSCEQQDIRAEDLGAPHKRERIWIVAYPERGRCGTEGKRRSVGQIRKERDNNECEVEKSDTEIPNPNNRPEKCEIQARRELFTNKSKRDGYLSDSSRELSHGRREEGRRRGEFTDGCEIPNADNKRELQPEGMQQEERGRACNICNQRRDAKFDRDKPYLKCPECGLRCYEIPNTDSNGRSGILREARQGENGPELRENINGESAGIGREGAPRKRKSNGELPNTISQHDDNSGYGASEICGERSETSEISGRIPNTDGEQAQWITESRGQCNKWPAEPAVGRLAYGLSGRVDRLKGLGNAIVPQIAEILFNQIKVYL
jgi:DNA (cytosine-5)-methyltransferase 1